ncbi:glycosidase crf1 [Penicillium coprophilum]|uniref:glycosidase crf1 n=1 Tax=Penicillium coprophilum TaxID=36646 RepID=UPI002392AC4A|nr:glycosidase crf1 [Penicillium coprophilum]KAJ5153667.1 glycosidase crf1 [Penicillium coprophilum]
MRYHLLFAALAAPISLILAQKAPDCNAFQKTCASNRGNTEGHITYDLTQASPLSDWTTIGGEVVTGSNGAEFTIRKQGDAPTIVTDYYIFYGEVSVEMKASPGTGIVSSVYMLSDDNDEIGWEALGGFTDKIQTDYYGKGDNSGEYNRWTWQPVINPQGEIHRYTWIWAKEKLSWVIDGTVVRTVDYADTEGGTRFPQTPMRVRIGIWAGDDPSKTDPSKIKGAIEWAGGKTDYSKAPFTMYVKSVEIVNYTPAESYVYSDRSGSSDSVEIRGAISSGETSSLISPGTLSTADISISTFLSTELSSSISISEFSGATTNTSSPTSTLPMTSSAESKSTVLHSNSTSARSSMTTPGSTSNSSTGAIASATSSFSSAFALDSGFPALLATIVGFIQLWA